MQVAFICAPYTTATDFERKQNIEHAARMAAKVWALGYATICPQMNSAFFGGCTDEFYFYEGYKELLKRADIIVKANGIRDSKGCKAELHLAALLGKPIFNLCRDSNLRKIDKSFYDYLKELDKC